MSDNGQLRTAVISGPGHHDAGLFAAARAISQDCRIIRSWPRFVVEHYRSGAPSATVTRHPLYSVCERGVWGVWRRLPVLRRYETPRGPLSALADLIASRYVADTDLVVAWAHVSFRSLRAAKAQGAATVLEHPMCHIDRWTEIVSREYSQWGHGGRYLSLRPRWLVRRVQREYEEADAICVPSRFARDTFVQHGVAQSKLKIVPMGVDCEQFQPGPGRHGRFRVLYVGLLRLLKGVQYLLQAFAELRLPDAELLLVGAITDEIKPVLDRFGGAGVQVMGAVSHHEVAQHYRQADVVVFPSLADGFGLAISEAMASAVPVIATEHSAGPDLISDGRTGIVVPPGNVEAIKESLFRLYKHRDDCREMGWRARETVVSAYTSTHRCERLTALYTGLASRTPTANSGVDQNAPQYGVAGQRSPAGLFAREPSR